MNNPIKIYDYSFKRMFRLSKKPLIKFVNKVFGKKFPLNSKVMFLDTNTVKENGKLYEKDLYFIICGERFHLEAQAYHDDMLIRLFNYAVSDEECYKRVDDSHAVFRMPQQAVVFLKDTDKSKDKLYIKLILPDEQEIEYSVHAIRSLGYTPQELLLNDMEILLPFQIIRLYGSVKKYHRFSKEKKEEFLDKFSKMCSDIVETLNILKTEKSLTKREYKTMVVIIRNLKNHIYSSIDDIQKKGADSMLNEEFMFWDEEMKAKMDKAIAEERAEKEKAIAEERAEKEKALAEKSDEINRQFAEKMILNGESAEKIEEYTGLRLSVLKSMAQSLGKVLML